MFNLLVLLVIITINIFLLGLILKRARNSNINKAFSVVIISAILWAICNYFADFKNMSDELALWVSRGSFISAGILIFGFFLFCYYFPVKSKLKFLGYIFYPLSALTISLALTPYIISGVTEQAWGWDIIQGDFYYLYVFYVLFGSILSFIMLATKYRTVRGVSKIQIKYMFFGTFLTAFFATLTNLVLPLITGTNPLAKYGAYSLLFLIGFTTYTIVKHRLMDIRLVVAKSVTYTLVLVLLAGFYAGSVLAIERIFFPNELNQIDLVQGGVRTILAVVMAFSFQPLKRWITRRTDRIFFKNAYSPEQLLDTLSHTLSSTIVLVELLYKVTDILVEQMKISRGMFILLKGEDRIYTHLATGYKDSPKIELDDVLKLAKNGTAVYDELEENSHFKTLLRKFEASVSIPLKTEKELVGVFLVGEKSSGDMFSQGDLRILEILGPEISVAIENARSYEEINRFNVTLRNEVNRATKRLKEKNEQLRELDIAKDEFISMASHQLRTPLTAIKGYLSMLLDGDAGEIKVGQYDFIHEAYAGANRMVGLINDLLNVSRMETGRFFIEPIEVDIVQATSEEAKQFATTAKEKGIYLRLDVVGKIPHVWVDEMKIRQVIMNLIDNAVHYTQKGGVTAKLYKDKHDLIFEVTDTGIGIPKEQQHKLFEKFYRADNARHIRPDGTGLGIYLAKRVVEDHGGEIMFRSIENRGSTFGFKLPLSSITKQRAYTPPEKPKKKESKEIRPVRVEEILANKEVMDEPADLTGVKF